MAEDMSPGTALASGALRKKVRDLIVQACEADDVELISQAITLASSPGSSTSLEKLVQMAFPRMFSRNAPTVLDYILTHGAVKDIASSYNGITRDITYAAYEREFPKALVQILLDHGWDINHRQCDQPLLWQMVDDGEAVAWCLERGATVFPKGQRPWPEFDINNAEEFVEYFKRFPYTSEERSDCLYYCPPILELAARQSTVATFELLRSKGAPLGWRVLHMAVSGCASMYAPDNSITEQTSPTALPSDEGKQPQLPDRQLARTREERMRMVRHLVDTLKLDVNARDQPPGWMLGNFWGRPLHYIAHLGGSNIREVTLFLLDRGANPELVDGGMTPMVYGKGNFLDGVKEWRLIHTGDAGHRQSGDGADHNQED